MLFNSFEFLFLFLPIVYLVFWSLSSAQSRYVWLAVTGYVFYGYWDPRFCLLMAFSTLVSFTAGLSLLKFTTPRARKLCLIVPITIDLCLLAFFKYTDFLIGTVRDVSAWLGHRIDVPLLNIILPVGISFYTFHTITYIVDSYRGTIRPTKNLFEFAAYVSLFSQLVAGPIVRFRQIEEDLESLGKADRTRWLALGIGYFLYGMVEKTILADQLAAYVDPALASFHSLSTTGAWLAALGYSFQLYFDFCGYSDMAIGLGYMFGFRIPINFNSPYKALDPSDFWRRWHISLSTCLRDYLYIPMGGNRNGEVQLYRNLMFVMLLGGLWHGANWTFVFWGFYHGLLLCAYRPLHVWWDRLPVIFRQLSMFLLAIIGWVLFRSTSFTMANEWLTKMFVPTGGELGSNASTASVFILIAMLWAMVGPNAIELFADFRWKPAYGYVFAAVFGACLSVLAAGGNSPFLYFQF